VQLSIGHVEGDTLRCRYHGWQFDAAGQCIDQPAEPEPFCKKIRIQAYPVEEHLGLVFAYLGDGPPPPFPRWPEIDALIKKARGAPSSVAIMPFNFFQSEENIVDDTHVPFLHGNKPFPGQTGELSTRMGIPHIRAEETPFGLTQFVEHPTRPVDAVDRTTLIHFLMPNQVHMYAADADTTLMIWYVPIDDTKHLHFVVFLPRDVRKKDYVPQPPPPGYAALLSAPADLTEPIRCVLDGKPPTLNGVKLEGDYPNRIRVEDGVVLAGQGAIAARSGERLGQGDAAVILLRKLWTRDLRLLAAQKPTTPYQRSEFVAEYERHVGPVDD
jgi:5,5'-dehydrodivanillate O-demethylase